LTSFQQRLEQQLCARQQQDLYRQRLSLDSAQGPTVKLQGGEFLNFCSNDYLGLAAHPKVVSSFQRAAQQYGVGSGGSHLVCGHSAPHRELEEALAEFTGRPRALLFSSGYQANTGVLGALLEVGDAVFQDRLNHASLLDGGLHSDARFRRFPHNDVAVLEHKLSMDRSTGNRLVVVDGVFSMDGDCAPLAQLSELCEHHQAWLMVDDAHGFGVLGDRGMGSTELAGLGMQQVPVLMATLGKALGTAGAFISGSETLIEGLIQQTRSYIYTTAMPPALASASHTALKLMQEEDWRRFHLRDLIVRFRNGAEQLGIPLMPSQSAIQPMVVGDAQRALALSTRLREAGILIAAIRPPTVPKGSSRLRITLSAAHSEEHIDQLLEQLGICWRGT